jgi:hypothetical protein
LGVPLLGVPLDGVALPACGLFWKYVTHSLGTEVGSDW